MRETHGLGALTALLACVAVGPAIGTAPQRTAAICPGAIVGDLGYNAIECHDCVIDARRRGGAPPMVFHQEPVLLEIRVNGPAAGKLEERDVLTAIDGEPITTDAGARRYADVRPGRPVRLTIRRGDTIESVSIIPSAKCERVEPSPKPSVLVLGPRRRAKVTPPGDRRDRDSRAQR